MNGIITRTVQIHLKSGGSHLLFASATTRSLRPIAGYTLLRSNNSNFFRCLVLSSTLHLATLLPFTAMAQGRQGTLGFVIPTCVQRTIDLLAQEIPWEAAERHKVQGSVDHCFQSEVLEEKQRCRANHRRGRARETRGWVFGYRNERRGQWQQANDQRQHSHAE